MTILRDGLDWPVYSTITSSAASDHGSAFRCPERGPLRAGTSPASPSRRKAEAHRLTVRAATSSSAAFAAYRLSIGSPAA